MEIYKNGKILSFDEIKESEAINDLPGDYANTPSIDKDYTEASILNKLIYKIIAIDRNTNEILLNDEHNNKYIFILDNLDENETKSIFNNVTQKPKYGEDNNDLSISNLLKYPELIENYVSKKYINPSNIPSGITAFYNEDSFIKINGELSVILADRSFYKNINI